MPTIQILGQDKPVSFMDDDPALPLQPDVLMSGLQDVADLINQTVWTDDQRAAFDGMLNIVFFQGAVIVNGYSLERPGCDEAKATFYWESKEFMANTDACVRANTFFHDCWHVVQYKRRGYARDDDERVAREVDAINQQIVAAQAMGCGAADIAFLENFEADQDKILARLREGVADMHHA